MSLLDEIRSDLTNQSADLSNTLRKAKVLASRIGLDEFREWVDSELSGYKDLEKLPSYRRFRPTNIGNLQRILSKKYQDDAAHLHPAGTSQRIRRKPDNQRGSRITRSSKRSGTDK